MSDGSQPERPIVALLIPESRRAEVLTEAALIQLHQLARIREAGGDSAAIASRLPSLLRDADVAITGWGSPPLPEEVLGEASRLRLIAHTAGSVKRLIPPSAFDRGITVCHAASVIADAVAEMTVLYALLGLRRVHEMSQSLKSGAAWRDTANPAPRLLGAQSVGLVGAGYVGRKVARLIRAFGSEVLVYDPYLSPADAADLGVELVSLADLFQRGAVVSIHAPVTPETVHLVGATELSALRDGATFINCSRSRVVDSDALLAQLRTGRFWAALDVFDEEPLPLNSPFRALPNVLLTPHQAGHTLDTYRRQGQEMVDEVARFIAGDPLRFRIRPESFALLA